MLTALWRKIRFSVAGQLVWESVASVRRTFEASTVGILFYKLPLIVRVLIAAIPILLIVATPIAIHYALLTTEATGRIDVRRPGDSILWLEGTTFTSLDDVELQFPPTLAKDTAGVASFLQPIEKNYAVEFHKDRTGERVDKILVRMKSGTKVYVSKNLGGTIAREGDKPKRFQIHMLD